MSHCNTYACRRCHIVPNPQSTPQLLLPTALLQFSSHLSLWAPLQQLCTSVCASIVIPDHQKTCYQGSTPHKLKHLTPNNLSLQIQNSPSVRPGRPARTCPLKRSSQQLNTFEMHRTAFMHHLAAQRTAAWSVESRTADESCQTR